MTGIMMSVLNSVPQDSTPEIVSGAVLNLDPATGLSGSTWDNTGSLGATLDYTLYNTPGTATVNGSTVLSFAGGAAEVPGSMTGQYAFNATGFSSMASASQAFTLDIWACPRAANAGCLIKEFGGAATTVPVAGWEDAWINFYDGTINTAVWFSNSYASAGSYTQDTWYCISMVYNGSNQLLTYVNGVLASTQNNTRLTQGTYCQLAVASCERYAYLGPDPGGSSPYFTGYVGAFKVYYSALTADQVLQNYNALKGVYGL